jgi:predicted DCC family thiol-disulfide oxidoreductase YuxK
MSSSGWTGGQYSLWRAILGVRLAAWLVDLLPRGAQLPAGPWAVALLLSTGVVLSAYLIAGRHDRFAAVALLGLGSILAARDPLVLPRGAGVLAGLLLAHALVPAAPYGSWDARGRVDPAGGWRMPRWLPPAAWAVLAAGHVFEGWTRLAQPAAGLPRPLEVAVAVLQLAFAPLALSRRLRPWLWAALFGVRVLLAPFSSADLGAGILLLHLLAFDPRWLPPLAHGPGPVLFYDGACGLCHRAVRFLLAEDRGGALRYAPLGGETFRARVPEAQRAGLPDSLVLRFGDGRLLVRSAAVLLAMRLVGGAWRAAAAVAAFVPAALLDRTYDALAAVRLRLFARPETSCPVVPPRLQERFEP